MFVIFVLYSIFLCKIVQNMISSFTSLFKPHNVSVDNQLVPHSKSVIVHSLNLGHEQFLYSLVGALNSGEVDIQSRLISVAVDI